MSFKSIGSSGLLFSLMAKCSFLSSSRTPG
uniref:Uncharacterized protein n=1 Tax=Rhizophora mucronata TaxID=61149 RepID=A0A2P2QVB4_RHIMU